MYDRILLATDGSEAVEPAIDHAIELADHCDATLTVVNVVDASAAAAVPEAQAFTISDILEDAGEEAIVAVTDRAEAMGIPVESEVRHGRAHVEILEAADEIGADLIVLGTHGRSGIDRVLLGSVASRVIRQADQPVLVKRGPE